MRRLKDLLSSAAFIVGFVLGLVIIVLSVGITLFTLIPSGILILISLKLDKLSIKKERMVY